MPAAPDILDANAVAVFLDVDGTLLEIRDDPSEVRADDELIAVLRACEIELDGALSLVSGRSIDEVDRIFAPAVFPVAGAHGAELRFSENEKIGASVNALPEHAVEAVEAFVDGKDGLLVEHKRGGVSLHYRRAPQLESQCRRFIDSLVATLGEAFRLIDGKMVLEIAPGANDKGAAIRAFLAHSPFAGRRPVFVGDDVTDEDGFREVNELAGVSIRIGDAGQTAATYRLPDVSSARLWLQQAILGGRPIRRMESKDFDQP